MQHIKHVKLFDCDDVAIDMPCSKRYVDDIIACTLLNNCYFQCFACNDVTNGTPRIMLCHECFTISPVACNKLNNCSFTCFACNNNSNMVYIEMAPIAFSNFGDFDDFHDKHVPHLHTHHAPMLHLIDTNGDVHKKRYVMMDDVFIYHTNTFFLLCLMCVGTRTRMSTSVEHELTKRALESIPQVSSRLNPALYDAAVL